MVAKRHRGRTESFFLGELKSMLNVSATDFIIIFSANAPT